VAYITATDLKNYMKINGNSDDTQLALFADRAQHVVDSYTHRVFEWAGAGTVKKFTPVSYLDGGDLYDMYTLSLGLNEFYELTSITNGDGVAISTSDVVLLPQNITPKYAVRIKSSANKTWTYTTTIEESVSITAKWAYSATAPADIVQAALRIGAYLYRQRDGTPDSDRPIVSADGVVLSAPRIPSDVLELLRPYRRRS
jgi:maltoporin